MNLLIFGSNNNLRIVINMAMNCLHLEFTAKSAVINFAPTYELWTDCSRLFVVGNSRQRLENAFTEGLQQVRLSDADLLTETEFRVWNERRGWLQAEVQKNPIAQLEEAV